MKLNEYRASQRTYREQARAQKQKPDERAEVSGLRGVNRLSRSVAEARGQADTAIDHDAERIEVLLQPREGRVVRPRENRSREEAMTHRSERDDVSGLTEHQTEALTGELTRNEKLLAKPYRHHWSYLIIKAFIPAIFTFGLLALIVVGFTANIVLLSAAAFIPFAICAFFLFSAVYRYWNDYLVVTNFRFVRVRRDKFIDNERQQLPVERAEESRLDSNRNIVQLLLGVGQITIPGAGANEGNQIVFKWVHDPKAVQTVVEKARSAARARISQAREGHIIDYTRSKIENKPLDLLVPDMTRRNPIRQGESFMHDLFPIRPEVPNGPNKDFRLIFHKHWILLVEKVGALVLFFLVDVSVGTWFMTQVMGLGLTPLGLPLLSIVALVAWLGAAIALASVIIYRYVDWKNDLYIITNSRVIDIERKPFGFDNTRLVIPLTKVQKSEKTRRNFLELFFNYGNVEIFTASGEKALDFVAVPFPEKVEEEITYRAELAKERDLVLQDQRTADLMAQAARAGLFSVPPPHREG